MNSRRRVVGLVLAVIGIICLASPAAAQNSVNGLHRLPGSWHSLASTPTQAPFPGLFTFSSDGVVMGTESPGPFESFGVGSWEARGGDAALTLHGLLGSARGAGLNTGRIRVVGLIHYDAATDTWSGPFKVDVYDPAGNVLFHDRGQFTLTRIVVESLD